MALTMLRGLTILVILTGLTTPTPFISSNTDADGPHRSDVDAQGPHSSSTDADGPESSNTAADDRDRPHRCAGPDRPRERKAAETRRYDEAPSSKAAHEVPRVERRQIGRERDVTCYLETSEGPASDRPCRHRVRKGILFAVGLLGEMLDWLWPALDLWALS